MKEKQMSDEMIWKMFNRPSIRFIDLLSKQ